VLQLLRPCWLPFSMHPSRDEVARGLQSAPGPAPRAARRWRSPRRLLPLAALYVHDQLVQRVACAAAHSRALRPRGPGAGLRHVLEDELEELDRLSSRELFVLKAPARAPGFAGVKKSIFRLRSLRVRTSRWRRFVIPSSATHRGQEASARASIALLSDLECGRRAGALRCRRARNRRPGSGPPSPFGASSCRR